MTGEESREGRGGDGEIREEKRRGTITLVTARHSSLVTRRSSLVVRGSSLVDVVVGGRSYFLLETLEDPLFFLLLSPSLSLRACRSRSLSSVTPPRYVCSWREAASEGQAGVTPSGQFTDDWLG